MSKRYELKQGWTLSFTHPVTKQHLRMAATVPGNVEIDLQREGVIADPHPADNPVAMRPFESVNDWVYETRFDAVPVDSDQKVSLVFAGIDTIADVILNGEKVLRCENMFIPHTLDVTGKLKDKDNVLSVHIFSPELHARKFEHTPFSVVRDFRQGCAYLRKARHMWGWDNAPRLLSAGLWRPVALVVEDEIKFVDVYAYTQKIQGNSAAVGINWTIDTPDVDLSVYRGKLILSFHGKVELERDFEVSFTAGRILYSVPSPQLWWPRGYGEPNLYDLKLVLYRDEQIVAEWSSKFGIREIALIRTDTTNAKGDGEFVFKCNGEKIYINGTNWKPLDALHSLADAKVHKALDLCIDLHCNMVRIWGGGIYEGPDFFDYCDTHGLLVWQDFMFACEFPPRDEFYQKQVAHEAKIIIKQLRNHASLALWCGDNEDDMTVFWGLFVPPPMLPSYNEMTRKVLKNAVLEYDPYRSYLESSPYISDIVATDRWAIDRPEGEDKMSLMAPEQHVYATGQLDFYTLYRKSNAHFVSETGPFFINSMSQSSRMVEREVARTKRLWNFADNQCGEYKEHHQCDSYFLLWKDRVQKHLKALFDRDFSIDDWNELALGVNIATGNILKFSIEYARVRKWRKTGVIWWSLLDMWPMMFNYSIVDSDFKKKQPVYGWIRQSQQASCLIAEQSEDGESISVFAVNDTLKKLQGQYQILSLSGGEIKKEYSSDLTMEANASSLLVKIPTPKTQSLWTLEWTINGKTSFNHLVCGKPPFSFDAYREWCLHLERLTAKQEAVSPALR
jgi:beta-mannosidase